MVMEKYKNMSEIGDPRTLVFTKNDIKTLHKILTTDPDKVTITEINDCYTLRLKLDKLINYLNTKNKSVGAKITYEDRSMMLRKMKMISELTGEDVELYTGLVTESIDFDKY